MSLSTERRSVDLVDAELKGKMFRGLAAVFDSPWNQRLIDQTGYIEVIKRGAFRKALSNGEDVPFLIGHDEHQLLGTTKSGRVRLNEDAKGLLVEARLPDNHLGEYARSMIESGDIQGMSYGMEFDRSVDTQRITQGIRSIPTILVTNARRLLDVSLAWQPAYAATSVELRSAGFVASTLQEIDSGVEEQTVEAATETPPDDEAWWAEKPADAAPSDLATPWWETYAKELERRF